jgi:hypothetical protein
MLHVSWGKDQTLKYYLDELRRSNEFLPYDEFIKRTVITEVGKVTGRRKEETQIRKEVDGESKEWKEGT